MKALSLFSGIGGIDLACEWAGIETVAFCEIDPFCRKVLAKHWPGKPIFEDVTKLKGSDVGAVDIVTGGFPCQPFSTASAGKRKGKDDHRFLWPEMCRIILECKPAWVIGENVVGIKGVVLEQVVSDLEALGFEVTTLEIPACAVGFDHWRPRIWFLGYSDRNRKSSRTINAEMAVLSGRGHEAGSARAPDGISKGLDGHRRRAIGNAVNPYQVLPILKAIKTIHRGLPHD
jgi:DNA (cytosine-5)-methyltransferase 1